MDGFSGGEYQQTETQKVKNEEHIKDIKDQLKETNHFTQSNVEKVKGTNLYFYIGVIIILVGIYLLIKFI